MEKQTIQFTNTHGTTVLEIGERYDLDVAEFNGDVFPISDVKVVSDSEERLYLEDNEGVGFPILKELIVHETKID